MGAPSREEKMKYRNFGDSDLVTSVIGFGGWPMGRDHYGSFDEEEVIRAVHLTIDLGVTLFDTASVYGRGEGEKLLGRALAGRRDEVVLVSKGGLSWDNPDNPSERNSSKEALTKGLEDSLTRLQTDHLDLYLVHWPDVTRPFSEPMEAFSEFQRQGKIRYGGVSNFSAAQMRESLDTFPIICNQVGYHLFDFRPEAETFPFCRENGLGVMVYGPMAHGLLTGAMSPDTTFEDNDWRRSLQAFGQPLFEGEHFLNNLNRVEELKKIADERGRTVAQLALAWVLSNPAVSVALAGTRRPSEMEENVLAADWDMGPEEREEIASVVSGGGAG
jgi:aryl-alcohol dehydrogenase-like predicted oxidoreductase